MKKIIVVLAVLLFFGALTGCTSSSGKKETPQEQDVPPAAMEGFGNSPLNIVNTGYAVTGGGVLYYADRQNGGNIWRADADGGNARMLAEGAFKYLNVSGDRLFFADWDGIYVMPTDGAQPQLIKECRTPSLCVLDEWLYYTEDACIYRMKADGAEVTLLAENVWGDVDKSFIIDGDQLYYLRETEDAIYRHIWKTSLDGSESARVSDAKVWDFLIYEDHIYYVDWEKSPYGLQKMGLDGSGRQEIYDRNVTLCTAADGWIYLLSKPRKDAVDGLYRIKTDGSGLTNLTEGYCFDMSVAGDWLFFCSNDEEYRISKIKPDGSQRGFVNE